SDAGHVCQSTISCAFRDGGRVVPGGRWSRCAAGTSAVACRSGEERGRPPQERLRAGKGLHEQGPEPGASWIATATAAGRRPERHGKGRRRRQEGRRQGREARE